MELFLVEQPDLSRGHSLALLAVYCYLALDKEIIMKLLLKIMQNQILSILILAVLFMWLTPFGSFLPTKLGFYLAIFQATGTVLLTDWLIKKYRVKESPKSNDPVA